MGNSPHHSLQVMVMEMAKTFQEISMEDAHMEAYTVTACLERLSVAEVLAQALVPESFQWISVMALQIGIKALGLAVVGGDLIFGILAFHRYSERNLSTHLTTL